MHGLREDLQCFDRLGRERRSLYQVPAESGQVGFPGELSVPEEPDDLLERSMAGEILDGVSLVGEPPVGAIEVAQASVGGDDAFEASNQAALDS
jgi:hypothetical protein